MASGPFLGWLRADRDWHGIRSAGRDALILASPGSLCSTSRQMPLAGQPWYRDRDDRLDVSGACSFCGSRRCGRGRRTTEASSTVARDRRRRLTLRSSRCCSHFACEDRRTVRVRPGRPAHPSHHGADARELRRVGHSARCVRVGVLVAALDAAVGRVRSRGDWRRLVAVCPERHRRPGVI
jgi:hypothetical protein